MLRINQLKFPPSVQGEALKQALYKKTGKILGCTPEDITQLDILKCSIDARKKPDIVYSYTVDIQVKGKEDAYLKRIKDKNQVQKITPQCYHFPKPGGEVLTHRPVIVGTGPCGLFAGYMLALHGYRPILLERGANVEARQQDVENFWKTGVLKPESNVQFGEGGAGTFSDGKMNTLVKDKDGRGREVLRIFVEAGAPEHILYDAKPHIGTDVLTDVVKYIREAIQSHGGEIRFHSKVTDFYMENGKITGVCINDQERLDTSICILAIGHSARDTYEMLQTKGVPMEAKSFAVGFRVEHPQRLIDNDQYGCSHEEGGLPTAAYKVTAKTSTGRGVYSFCMCPGGYVVNASSEEGMVAVNGMSYSKRDGANANSAIIVSVTPKDYPDNSALAGIAFQRKLEKKAWELGQGKVPVETYGDFKKAVTGESASSHGENFYKDFQPCHKGEIVKAPVHEILTGEMNQAFVEGMEHFDHILHGFANGEAMVSGVESRTSSPVRICRNQELESEVQGLYPCGEGAGFAGGITSAAMDGLRVAEVIGAKFQPFSEEGARP